MPLAQALAQGRQMIGPAQSAPKKEGRFSAEDLDFGVEERRAIGPAGKQSTQCSRLEEEASGKVSFRFEWGRACADCHPLVPSPTSLAGQGIRRFDGVRR